MAIDQEGKEYDPHDTQGRDPVRWGKQQRDSLKILGWGFLAMVIGVLLELARRYFTQ